MQQRTAAMLCLRASVGGQLLAAVRTSQEGRAQVKRQPIRLIAGALVRGRPTGLWRALKFDQKEELMRDEY